MEGLAQRRRHTGAVGLLGNLRIVSQELLKGAHDLGAFEVRRGTVDPLSGGVPAP